MPGIQVTPQTLTKKLVGETLLITITFPSRDHYDTEVWGDFNGISKRYTGEWRGSYYEIGIPLIKSGFYSWTLRFRRTTTKRWHQFTDKHGNKAIGKVQVDPAWIAQAIVYNIFVRFFKGSQDTINYGSHEGTFPRASGMGTFDDVKAHLDALRALKINVLYLNPIHPIGELNRGFSAFDPLPPYLQPGSPYSIKDYKAIDTELTFDKDTQLFGLSDPQQEFKDLIEAAHERGMFVFMDLVFNHTAHDFVLQRMHPEWYLYKEKPTNLSSPYLYPEEVSAGKPWGNPIFSVPPYDHTIWWEDCAQLNWEYMLPEAPNDPPPNYSLKEMWHYFVSIPKYWIKHFGIDGFRCDVAYRIPIAFWRRAIAEAREAARRFKNNLSYDVVFIAESYTNDLLALQEAGFTAVYGDYTHKITSALTLKGYLDYIYNISGTHFPEGSRWFHFPESHDFGRTPTKILGLENVNDVDAAMRVNKSRWLLTATLPGIPLIFNGFEHIEWKPINIMSYGAVPWHTHPELQDFIIKINDLRHHSPILQKGNYLPLETNQGLTPTTQLFAFIREFNHEQLIIIVNMDVYHQAGPALVYLPASFKRRYNLTDLLTGRVYEREGTDLLVMLPPGEGHIFSVERLNVPG